jgi:hypothetical protein
MPVNTVSKNGPAEPVGISQDDISVEFDCQPKPSITELQKLLQKIRKVLTNR